MNKQYKSSLAVGQINNGTRGTVKICVQMQKYFLLKLPHNYKANTLRL